ncbi:MAG: hypothetical protein ACRCX2_08005 [Paraclostridium sp.]
MAKMHPKGEEFLELCNRRYFNDPALFAKEVIGIILTEEQQVPAVMALANGKKKVAVKSGHGTGKSCLSAVVILWFLCTRPMARVIITAPSSNQLYNTMMSEIRLWYNNSILSDFGLFYFTKDRVRLNHEKYSNNWFASAVSVANPENISGTHAEHVLAVVDEGAGVDSEIFVRLEGVLTTEGSYLLTCGNPSFDSGYFYDIFHNPDYTKQYDCFTFSCTTSKNVDTEWIAYMADKYGEDSNIYKVRVLGEFAPLNEEVIIRREDVKKAIGRESERDMTEPVFIGVDVSSGDSNDYSVICIRQGYKEIERIKVRKKLAELREDVIMYVNQYICMSPHVTVNIDTTGLGYQLGQELEDYFWERHNIEVNKINFSFRASLHKIFGNVATEMFFLFKEILPEISLLVTPETTVEEDLGARRYGYDNANRFIAEKKKEFIKRFKRSPDEGDAVLLAFYDVGDINKLEEIYFGREDW